MAENSLIGWTTHTFNPWMGCHKVSEECRHCYISTILKRQGREPFKGPSRTKHWSKPLKWNRQAAEARERPRVFTCSMSDFFHYDADQWRPEAWNLIRECPNLDWLILTKRPERILSNLPGDWGKGWPHVWLGTTCGVRTSLPRVAQLTKVPAAVRFISAEPLIEPIDFTPYLKKIQWVITGCESAAVDKRRPMELSWVKHIDRQCREAGVPHFFKQRYVGTKLVYDGKLDGRIRQAVPQL